MHYYENLSETAKAKLEAYHTRYSSERLSAGTHVKMIKGRPAEVEVMMEEFYKTMTKQYPNFKVLQTSSGWLPYGIAMTITFSV